jgi:hypothetical protein
VTHEEWLAPAAPSWDGGSYALRAHLCVLFLLEKGLLTESERAKISRRFARQFDANDSTRDREDL